MACCVYKPIRLFVYENSSYILQCDIYMFKFYRVHIEARAYAIFAQVYLVCCVFVWLEVFRP